MSARERLWSALAAVPVLGLAADAWAQGCAMCKASLPGAEDPLSQGFNYSIFMFLGVTYSLFGLVGGWIGFRYWRGRSPRTEPRVLPFEAARKEEVL